MGSVARRPRALTPLGFTLLELVVAVSIVALLFGVALDRLLRYQELAERAAMEQNLAAINVALTMKFASLVVNGSGKAIEKEVGANPVELLARPPDNYLGALYAPPSEGLPRRSWYYDRESGDLVYVPSRARYLSAPADAEKGLRFRIVLTDPSPRADDREHELRQPVIRARQPYRWEID